MGNEKELPQGFEGVFTLNREFTNDECSNLNQILIIVEIQK